jgi:hypothetical protein
MSSTFVALLDRQPSRLLASSLWPAASAMGPEEFLKRHG